LGFFFIAFFLSLRFVPKANASEKEEKVITVNVFKKQQQQQQEEKKRLIIIIIIKVMFLFYFEI